jgi:hypothetical protein
MMSKKSIKKLRKSIEKLTEAIEENTKIRQAHSEPVEIKAPIEPFYLDPDFFQIVSRMNNIEFPRNKLVTQENQGPTDGQQHYATGVGSVTVRGESPYLPNGMPTAIPAVQEPKTGLLVSQEEIADDDGPLMHDDEIVPTNDNLSRFPPKPRPTAKPDPDGGIIYG